MNTTEFDAHEGMFDKLKRERERERERESCFNLCHLLRNLQKYAMANLNLTLEISMRPVCLFMIFLLLTLLYLII